MVVTGGSEQGLTSGGRGRQMMRGRMSNDTVSHGGTINTDMIFIDL